MVTKPKVYLDTNCFIDMVRHKLNVPFPAEQTNRVRLVGFCKAILLASKNGDLEAYISGMTVAECLHAGDKNNISEEAKLLINGLLTSGKGGVVQIQPSNFVMTRARDLFWVEKIKIKTVDRIHLASALEMGCDEFITTDNVDF